MKKIMSLLLALCMLLAAASALADSAAGTWYITMAEVTMGTFELSEDGTAAVNIFSQEPMTGTWSEEDTAVTITIDGQPQVFTNDGTSLTSEGFGIPVTREEGKISVDLISKMMNGEEYDLPEGMTELELATIAMNFVAEYTKMMEGASGTGESAGGETAQAAKPAVTVLNETFIVKGRYNGFEGAYVARVRNDTEAPLFITGGHMDVLDASGNVVAEDKYLDLCGSKYLEPGEVSFVSMSADLDADGEYSCNVKLEAKAKSYGSTDRSLKVENVTLAEPANAYEGKTMRATLVNDTDQPLAGFTVVFILEDADGKLLQLSTETLYRHELGANSTLTMVSSISSYVQEYCDAHEIVPSVLEAYAFVENDD